MKLNNKQIQGLEKIKRLNIINSLAGIKPANLIGTKSAAGNSNLAVFSSVTHLGSNPPLLGFMLRPVAEIRRHTYENILETSFYTINHIHHSFITQAHYTSAKFGESESEFKACDLNEEYIGDFPAPFVRESQIKLGLKFRQELAVEINNTLMMIGEIVLAIFPDESMDEEGHIDLSYSKTVGVGGLNTYYNLDKAIQLPYARPHEYPGTKS